MTGERWEWFRVASHLKIPVMELQHRITYREFIDWLVFLQKRETGREMIQDHYLAQIAAEVCRSRLAEPNIVKTSDFLVSFVDPESVPVVVPLNAEAEDRLVKSKSAWMGALNIRDKKKRKKK